MSGLTDVAENALIDWLLRGQALALNGSFAGEGTGLVAVYVGLFTANPTDSDPGVEAVGYAYARVQQLSNMIAWSGTQGVGTTEPSTGSTGTIYNNQVLVFPTPGSDWGEVVGAGLFDMATGGNLVAYGAFSTSRMIYANDDVEFPIGSIGFSLL